MTTSLRLLRNDGSLLAQLPDHEGLGAQQEHNDTGSFSCKYSRGGLNASAIDSDVAYVGLMVDGVEQPDRYMLEDDGEDPTGTGGNARMVDLAGRGVMAILEWAVIYPSGHTPGMTSTQLLNLEPVHAFADSTPGAIISTLIERAKARSTFDGANGVNDAIRTITYDFTAAVDSAGVAWPTRYSVAYDSGLDLLKVLLAATDNAWCDAQMSGMVLRLFAPDTVLGRDRPDVIVRAGREVTSGPRKRTRRPIRSHMLGVGDEGAIVERSNTAARSRYGRREGYEARSGITAIDTLTRVTDASLESVSDASEGFTLVCDLTAKGPQPYVDYQVGQRIRYDQRRLTDTALEPMRVRSVAVAWDKQGNRTASIEVNDPFVESQVRLKRKVDGIVNGSSSNSRAPRPDLTDIANDRLAPKAPASASINTGTFDRADGTIGAAATVSWTAVTQNVDGTVYDDAGNYFMSWSYVDGPGPGSAYPGYLQGYSKSVALVDSGGPEQFVGEQLARTEVAYVDGLRPGRRMVARVRTVDSSGNSSGWTTSPIVTIVADVTAPPGPTAPSVVSGLGVLRVKWDGFGDAGGGVGQPMPADLAHVEVHVSTVGPDYAPSTATLHDTLLDAGFVAVVSNIAYGTTAYVRLVAVDRTGNRSAPSVAVSGEIARVSGVDVNDNTLTSAKYADLSVIRAKIADLAVDDAKVANLSVGKLTAGVLVADITVSTRIKTADAGARVELNSLGLQAFDAAETKTFNVDAGSGAVMMVGTLQTAFSGARWSLGTVGKANTLEAYTGALSETAPGGLFAASGKVSMKGPEFTPGGVDRLPPTVECDTTFGTGSLYLRSGYDSQTERQGYFRMDVARTYWATGTLSSGDSIGLTGFLYYRPTTAAPAPGALPGLAAQTFNVKAIHTDGATNRENIGVQVDWSSLAIRNRRGGGSGFEFVIATSDIAAPSYVSVAASGFIVASAQELKRDIRPLGFSPLQAVMRAEAKLWKYASEVAYLASEVTRRKKGEPRWEGDVGTEPLPVVRERIGPMLADMPVVVRADDQSVDVAAQVGLLWAALRELGALVPGAHRAG